MQVTRGVVPARPCLSGPAGAAGAGGDSQAHPALSDGRGSLGRQAITLPDLRWARRDIKSVNLLPNCLARQAAREQGAIEAILYDEATGMVTEGAATTFWIVDEKGAVRTRHLDHVILPGCTRGALMAEMRTAGIAYEERGFTLEEAAPPGRPSSPPPPPS